MRNPLPPPPQRQRVVHNNNNTNTKTPPQREGLLNTPTPPNNHLSIGISSSSKQGVSPVGVLNYSPAPFTRLLNDDPLLHKPRGTHLLVWCVAIICLLFCLLVILFGIATLVIFLVIKPRYPSFDVSNARLNAIFFNSPENFNGDLTLLANFTNPNRKMEIRFDYLRVELYLVDRLIATQALEPFSQRPGEAPRLEVVHLISTLVYLPPNPAIQLQRQVQRNRVKYDIRGTFKVTARVGMARFSYWLRSRCQLEMTSPPSGLLLARNCSSQH